MEIQRKVEIVKKSIQEKCACQGYGCAQCAAKVERVLLYSSAGIPNEYWRYAMSSYDGDEHFKTFVTTKMNNIDDMYNVGQSYAFVGNLGVGKTFGSCEILKAGLVNKYDCCYTFMTEVVDMITNRETRFAFKQRIQSCDFLVIDEFDRRHVPHSDVGAEMFGATIESIIRMRFHHKLPTLFCSNSSTIQDVFTGIFGETFNSLFTGNVKEILVSGKDLRK